MKPRAYNCMMRLQIVASNDLKRLTEVTAAMAPCVLQVFNMQRMIESWC